MTKEELINKLRQIQKSIKSSSSITQTSVYYNMINGYCNSNFIKDDGQKVVPHIQELTKKSNANFGQCTDELNQYINELINAISNSEES